MTPRRVCVLVEALSAPGRNPLLATLAGQLALRQVVMAVFDATAPWSPSDLPDADLYLIKGDDPAVLAAAGCLTDRGAPCLNDLEATLRAADKARIVALLQQAGLPVPCTVVAANADAVASILDRAGVPAFVKPLRGAHGTGAVALRPGQRPDGDGPWLIQELVPSDSMDVKVYGVGPRTALRRMRVEPGKVDGVRSPVFEPDPYIARIAIAAADTCGLICWGADILLGPDGPVLVDVNAFPGYRSVPAAAAWVADAVIQALAADR
ncbi:ATP-grasp domain-containing protein [Kribbella catacumbae]|uniref:ATP-grasp domain-containing protein n=1 Tax=Kribbella catacumbae TaxID=460086 RepID=UPI00036FE70D|nr:ATP-grasp domain-containing protein [Kribbella catacumbae]